VSAGFAGEEISERGAGVGVAVCVSKQAAIGGSARGQGAEAPCERCGAAEGGEGGGAQGGDREAGFGAYAAAQFCDASAAARGGLAADPGVSGSCERGDDDDLYACGPGSAGPGDESAGYAAGGGGEGGERLRDCLIAGLREWREEGSKEQGEELGEWGSARGGSISNVQYSISNHQVWERER